MKIQNYFSILELNNLFTRSGRIAIKFKLFEVVNTLFI